MRNCADSKTTLQKRRRLWEVTGENRAARRKKMTDARGKTKDVVADAPADAQTKDDIRREQVEKEFAEKVRGPRKKKSATPADPSAA